MTDRLAQPAGTRLVLVVLDGLGGLPGPDGRTELEAAVTPNLDDLARVSSLGSLVPVSWGVTPGSGPGHFALFGYDPVDCNLGRGVLEAAGIDFDLGDRDVAARANFATVDGEGRIVDRRAGRPATEMNRRLCERLRDGIRLEGVEVFIETVSEHRFLVVFRGDGLGGAVADTDPQQTGVPPLEPVAGNEESKKTAQAAAAFVAQAARLLADEPKCNMVTFRGFDRLRRLPSLEERFRVRGLCLAQYPMYRGVSRLLGMALHERLSGLDEQIGALAGVWDRHDFFFLHYKETDKAGEDGDFDAKVAALEAVDRLLPGLLEQGADVLAITGDHSTPAVMASHSWHPVPLLLHARHCRHDGGATFGESACRAGSLGLLPSKQLMPLMLAHGGRLAKFGA